MALIRRNTLIATVQPTATDLTYSSGDVIGTVQTISSAVLDGKAGAELRSLIVLDKANQKKNIDLVFFNEAPATSIGVDGAAYNLAAADVSKIIGRVSIVTADYVSSTNNAEATLRNIGLMLVAAGLKKDIYVAVIARAALTLSADSDLSIKLCLEQF
jgi:hypothetical protein